MIALGIDCGTQGLKTFALDHDSGEILASASRSYGLIGGLAPGHLEQDPETWWTALEATVSEVLQVLGARRGEVTALGVSGQHHGLVPLKNVSLTLFCVCLACPKIYQPHAKNNPF